jgi:hypothetical protein
LVGTRLETMRESWRHQCVTVGPPGGAFILASHNKIHDTHVCVDAELEGTISKFAGGTYFESPLWLSITTVLTKNPEFIL